MLLKKHLHLFLKGSFNAELDAHLGIARVILMRRRPPTGATAILQTIQGSFGEAEIDTPRDREGTFEPVIIPKREKDVSQIEQKVLAMYARGMSQRDISSTIEEIYGFKLYSGQNMHYNGPYPIGC